ncbi:class I adenylate-forming enzyme family protein [Brevibacillus sp. NPDC058079]|uniref:class I adenylate-forming enzyme family protein n=1 Tax=Brevibacillus sp. NPDC058079 TaxID=3346330 RepID=UPI0036E59CE4
MNIGSSLVRNANMMPDRVAIIYQDQTYTYEQLNRIVNRLAHGLLSLGITKGEKICFMMKNSNIFPIALFAAAKIGAVTVPINVRLTKSEAAYLIDHSDAKLVIYDEEFGALIEQARSAKVAHCIAVHHAQAEGHLSLQQVLTENVNDPDVVVEQHDDSHILYTSGTTGRPKGAVFDHHRAILFIFHSLGLSGETMNSRILHFMPFFHGAGFSILFKDLFLGQTVVIQQKFDPVEVLKAIDHYKIQSFIAVPTMYNMMLQVPDAAQYDLSSIESLRYGGAPMSPELIKKSMELFKTDQFNNRCGLTEGGPSGIYLYPEEHKEKLGTSGKARFLTEAKVVDKDGKEIAPGEIGELLLRSDMIMKGYYKNSEATAEAIRDGWLYTGDLCSVDVDGFITLVDRKKDMIISGGSNIYSVEVENILYAFDGVLEAAVIGVPDEKWGEIVAAVIVAKPGYTIDRTELIEFCRKHLAGYKIPRAVIFTDVLPRNPSGKILKYELRSRYIKHQSESTSSNERSR